MIHINTRTQLLDYVAEATNDSVICDNINHGHTILWGRFVGGWVLETWTQSWGKPCSSRVVVGIKLSGTVGQDIICGRLSNVPWFDYIGGENEIDRGDYPKTASHNCLARKHSTIAPSCLL